MLVAFKEDGGVGVKKTRMALLAAFCLFASYEADAIVPASVLTLDMRDPRCTVQAAAFEENKEDSVGVVRGLNRQIEITNKFKRFMNSRKWKHNLSVGEQMTPAEANEFGNLQEQMKIGIFGSLLEAKRGRDIHVLSQMADTAKSMLSNFQEPKNAKSDAFALVGLLAVGRQKFQLSDTVEVDTMVMSQGKCSLQNALTAEAKRVLDSIDTIPGVHRASADMTGLGQKYGAPIDTAKLDDTEKLLYDRTTAVMDTAIKRQNYFKDLLFIARIDAVSKLQRDTRRQSQYEAPGDNAHIDVVWSDWIKEEKITKEQDELSRVVNYINERFPTEFMKSLPDKKAIG